MGVLSLKVTKEEEDGSKDAVTLTVAQLTDCGTHSGPSESREGLYYDPVYMAPRLSPPYAEIPEEPPGGQTR
jgi:hypothetical protein